MSNALIIQTALIRKVPPFLQWLTDPIDILSSFAASESLWLYFRLCECGCVRLRVGYLTWILTIAHLWWMGSRNPLKNQNLHSCVLLNTSIVGFAAYFCFLRIMFGLVMKRTRPLTPCSIRAIFAYPVPAPSPRKAHPHVRRPLPFRLPPIIEMWDVDIGPLIT